MDAISGWITTLQDLRLGNFIMYIVSTMVFSI